MTDGELARNLIISMRNNRVFPKEYYNLRIRHSSLVNSSFALVEMYILSLFH